MASNAGFWNRLAHRYAQQPIADTDSYEKKLTMTRRYLTADSHLLEFGCGTGSTALIHAPMVARIDAIDVSSEMVAIAEQKAKAAAIDNIHFRVGDIEQEGMPTTQYDVVLGLSILHLLANPAAVMTSVWQSLKPGGVFISSTVCMTGGIRLARPLFVLGRWLGLLPQVTMFDRRQLKTWLKSAGFDVLEEFNPNRRVCFLIARKPVTAT